MDKEKALKEAARTPASIEFKNIEKLENGHFEVTFMDGRVKEAAVVNSNYTTIWQGNCHVYLPVLAGLTPKKSNLMITKNNTGSHDIVYVAPRLSVGNVLQIKKSPASLVVNYYAEAGKDLLPKFQINDPIAMPLGKRVVAKVSIQLKENEKGKQIIVDCYVYEPRSSAKAEHTLLIQKSNPSGVAAFSLKIEGEERQVFVCH